MFPRRMRPIRLSRRIEPFDSDQFIFELKIDGFRSLAYIENSHRDFVSRNGNTFRNFKGLGQWIGEHLPVETHFSMAKSLVSMTRAGSDLLNVRVQRPAEAVRCNDVL